MAASQQCRVVVRLRPSSAEARCVEVDTAGQLSVGGGRGFAFDSVLSEDAGQEDVWAACGKPLVSTALSGCTSALLVYGQSGSGKTHTMGTAAETQAERGLMTRCAEALAGAGAATTLSLTLVEIYQERIRDLLCPSADNLALHEGEHGTYCGATDAPWSTVGDVERLLREGCAHRSVGTTALNAASSRSHLVLTLTATLPNGAVGKLILVDLAGSERAKRTGAAGGSLDEACAINKSLSALGNVISARSKAPSNSGEETAVVPYRDSKLTRLLRCALCGDAALTLILCASPAAADASETLSTLRFGARAKELVCTPAPAPPGLEAQLTEARRLLTVRDEELQAARLALAAAHAGVCDGGGGGEASGKGWWREAGWMVATWLCAVASVLA